MMRRVYGSAPAALALLLSAVLAVADEPPKQAAAQQQPADALDAEALAETQQRALNIAKELINELAGVEREQQALLQKLGEADRQLAEEKARADRLEREMARLLGRPESAPLPTTPAIEPSEPAGPPRLVIPPREVDALGIVDGGDVTLAEAPAAADALRLTPLTGTVDVRGSLRLVTNSREARFEHHDPLSGATPLATLCLRDGRIGWSWSNASSASARPSVSLIPWVLAGSTLEALAGGQVVGTWRFEPPTLRIAANAGRQTAPAPPFDDAVALSLRPMAGQPGWIVNAHSPTTIRVQSPTTEVTIDWRPGEDLVAASSRASGDLASYFAHQINVYERDLIMFRQQNPPNTAGIEQTEPLLADLREKKAAADAAAATPDASVSAYVVELVADTGVAVARYVIQP